MHYQPKSDLLDNRIIVVTGASDGIGREAALAYAHYGARVILLGRNATTLLLDLAHAPPESCQQLAQQVAALVPRLDGMLHNAGILGEIVPLAELDPAVWQQVMQINLDATFYLTQALLLESDAGSLVFTPPALAAPAG